MSNSLSNKLIQNSQSINKTHKTKNFSCHAIIVCQYASINYYTSRNSLLETETRSNLRKLKLSKNVSTESNNCAVLNNWEHKRHRQYENHNKFKPEALPQFYSVIFTITNHGKTINFKYTWAHCVATEILWRPRHLVCTKYNLHIGRLTSTRHFHF